MTKEWFPFFSMLFWCCTKLAGLILLVSGLWALCTMLAAKFEFWPLLMMAVAPMGIGYFLLMSDFVYDLGSAEQQRRQRATK